MSFFNQMLASIGIGSAKVDTRLNKASVRVGESLDGVVHIQGGNAPQDISSIYLGLMTQYLKQQGDSTVRVNALVEKWNIVRPLTVQPGQQVEVPFSVQIPLFSPVSLGRTPIWLKTGLDVDNAIDPGDKDTLQILPHPSMEAVLEAVKGMGFWFKEATCEYSSRLGGALPFVQEIEFRPGGSGFRGVKELELVCFVNPHGVEVIVEVDRRAKGLQGLFEAALDLDERKQRLNLSREVLAGGPQRIADQIASVIQRLAG
jgi:sporulation-control protein